MTTDLTKLPSNNRERPNVAPKRAKLRGTVRRRGEKTQKAGLASEVRDIFNAQFSGMMLPAVMRLIYEFLEGALRMMILGNDSGGGRRNDHVSYNRRYRNRSSRPSYYNAADNYNKPRRARRIQETPYEDVLFDNRMDAEDVLYIMEDVIREYGWCSVGHLYSICGEPNNASHQNWGWTSVRGVGIARSDDGYFIDLPNPVAG